MKIREVLSLQGKVEIRLTRLNKVHIKQILLGGLGGDARNSYHDRAVLYFMTHAKKMGVSNSKSIGDHCFILESFKTLDSAAAWV